MVVSYCYGKTLVTEVRYRYMLVSHGCVNIGE